MTASGKSGALMRSSGSPPTARIAQRTRLAWRDAHELALAGIPFPRAASGLARMADGRRSRRRRRSIRPPCR